ncbi:MAG: FeoC-like transcriptional regulator [Chloroflexota bacterium]
MLKRLLELLQEGGTFSLAELAAELEVSEALLKQMLDDLVRMGYLETVGHENAPQCQACPVKGCQDCKIAAHEHLWSTR